MTDVLLGMYGPRTYTADEEVKAGHVVHVTSAGKVKKVTSGDHVPAGVVLVDAASGALCTVVHGAWFTNVSGTPAVGRLMPSTDGGVVAYASTGLCCGFASHGGSTGEVFIY